MFDFCWTIRVMCIWIPWKKLVERPSLLLLVFWNYICMGPTWPLASLCSFICGSMFLKVGWMWGPAVDICDSGVNVDVGIIIASVPSVLADCWSRGSRVPHSPKDHVSILFAGNEGWWIYIVPLRKVHAPIESGENNPGCLGFRFIIDSTIRDHRVSRCWKYDTTSSGSDGYAENPLHSKILARLVKYDRNFDQISTF